MVVIGVFDLLDDFRCFFVFPMSSQWALLSARFRETLAQKQVSAFFGGGEQTVQASHGTRKGSVGAIMFYGVAGILRKQFFVALFI